MTLNPARFPEVLTRPDSLAGQHVTLAPLATTHRDGLAEAVMDGELWRLWFTTIPRPEEMSAVIARRLELMRTGEWMPYTILDPGGAVLGMTNFLNVDPKNRRLEIGGTWYRSSVQRSAVNTETKLLLLSRAFEDLDCIAVEFRTHFMNSRSRAAIERLGAKLDGVLRQHQRMPNGTLRDTCVYSIIDAEWPTTKANLDWQLAKPR